MLFEFRFLISLALACLLGHFLVTTAQLVCGFVFSILLNSVSRFGDFTPIGLLFKAFGDHFLLRRLVIFYKFVSYFAKKYPTFCFKQVVKQTGKFKFLKYC